MNKCKDCGRKVSRKEYIRCNDCNKKHKAIHKKEHKCLTCGKQLKNFYAKHCHKHSVAGKNNPNYKHGKCIENFCKCGKKIRAESIRCLKCNGKENSKKLKGRKFTKEHRKKLSLAFRNKIVSLQTRIKLSLSHGGTGIPYEKRQYSLDFYIVRKDILKRDNYICQKCAKKGNTVHHIDYNKDNNDKSNLITLCNRCNLQVNFNKDNWIKFFREKIQNYLTKNRR
jgi:hypothetical protein